MLKFTERKFCK